MSIEANIIRGLVRRGMPAHVAKGAVANMIVESRLDTGINEVKPLVSGSRGGFGLNQWTGPRRRQFEAFAQERGKPLDDLDAQLDFTVWELENTEKSAANKLYATDNVADATRVYSDNFLRPGIPHMDRRMAEAERLSGTNALSGYSAGMPMQQGPQAQQQNALAAYLPKFQSVQLDPRDFMMRA